MGRMSLPLPPIAHRESGDVRRLGTELEFSGPELNDVSLLIARTLHGEVREISRYEHVIEIPDGTEWKVEFDFELLKSMGKERAEREEEEPIDELAEEVLRIGSVQFVPLEVVTPPVPMDDLEVVEKVIEGLRELGARGTKDALRFAFGMHLNPEMPATDAVTIRRYLQAFLCLYDWLLARSKVDVVRRLTPYIDSFPKRYVRRVIDPGYAPGIAELIDDYLEENPTRNRALDMLPLFASLDEARVRGAVDDPRIKARPALHYRLPNCEIDQPDWGLSTAWCDWLQVESLVADPDRLEGLSGRYAEVLDAPLDHLLERWCDEVEGWLTSVDDH